MAKIKMAHIIAEARGKIGGTVFSRNTFGAYIRARVTPVNPATTAQALVRTQLTSLAQSWRGLTQAQRDAWNQGVVTFTHTDIFGDNVPLTGFNLFMQLNRNLLAAGQATIDDIPVPSAVFNFTSASLSADTTGGNLNLTFAPAIPAGTTMLIKAAAPLSAGKQFVKSELRQINRLVNGDVSPFDLDNSYIAKFGALPSVGTKVFVEMRAVNDATGLAGTRLKVSDIAV